MMVQIRIHGRGGQGAQIASTLLASAAFKEGKYGQSFAIFAGERRGAPVVAFVRIDERRILLRCQIYQPDHVIVLDPALAQMVDITAGYTGDGWLVMNSGHKPDLHIPTKSKVAIIDANQIALQYGLGSPGMPMVNTAMLGAFCRVTHLVNLQALREAITDEVPANKEANVAAAEEAYRRVKSLREGGNNSEI